MLSPAEIGARGNSHMIMQDKNNLQVADLILKWIGERVSKRAGERNDTQRNGSSDGEISPSSARTAADDDGGFDGRIPDEDIWSIVNYLRTLVRGSRCPRRSRPSTAGLVQQCWNRHEHIDTAVSLLSAPAYLPRA